MSKFRQTHVPQLVLDARVGGSGTLQLWGLVDGGTWLDPTPALPGLCLCAALWLIPRPGGEPGLPLQGL